MSDGTTATVIVSPPSDVWAVEMVGAAVGFDSIVGDGTGVLLGTGIGVAVETVVEVAETASSVEVGSG